MSRDMPAQGSRLFAPTFYWADLRIANLEGPKDRRYPPDKASRHAVAPLTT